MRLTQREIEKLMLHQAGFLAQKRLARGLRLNYPESVALIASQIVELIRDGDKVSICCSIIQFKSRKIIIFLMLQNRKNNRQKNRKL